MEDKQNEGGLWQEMSLWEQCTWLHLILCQCPQRQLQRYLLPQNQLQVNAFYFYLVSFLIHLIHSVEWSLFLQSVVGTAWQRGRSISSLGILLELSRMGYIKTAIPVPAEEREFGKTAQVLVNMYLFDFRAHPLLYWRFDDIPMLETARGLTEHARARKLQS